MAAWLRAILATTLAEATRRFYRHPPERAQSLERAIEESAGRLEAWLAHDESTPSQKAVRTERIILLAEALALLLPQCHITGVNAGHGWPVLGGDHHQVMAQLGLDLPAVLSALGSFDAIAV